jgi:hypothetical protein
MWAAGWESNWKNDSASTQKLHRTLRLMTPRAVQCAIGKRAMRRLGA